MSVRSSFDTTVQDDAGNALEDIQVDVYLAGTTDHATIYNSRTGGTTIANPITTDATGLVQFWTAAGSYDVKFHDTQVPARLADRTVGYESVSGASAGIAWGQIDPPSGFPPTGTILGFGGSSAPSGYLLCDGSAVSQSTYAALYAVIGGSFNIGGEGGGNFRLPDLRGRVPVGPDGSAGRLSANDTLGAYAGEEKHTLSSGELPSHTHTLTHGVGLNYGEPGYSGAESYDNIPAADFRASWQRTTGGAGSNTPHNTMQPYQIINYIIKHT